MFTDYWDVMLSEPMSIDSNGIKKIAMSLATVIDWFYWPSINILSVDIAALLHKVGDHIQAARTYSVVKACRSLVTDLQAAAKLEDGTFILAIIECNVVINFYLSCAFLEEIKVSLQCCIEDQRVSCKVDTLW